MGRHFCVLMDIQMSPSGSSYVVSVSGSSSKKNVGSIDLVAPT
jgi:hypothetical protein